MSTHKHKCPVAACGHVWRHGEECWGRIEPHMCPECGTLQKIIYHGPEEPGDKERGIKPVPFPKSAN